ncbi:OmpA family protein [bacterium]|nr:OmpA family protein [bacterium]
MRKKQRGSGGHEEGAGHERWLVSYADFITLLFAFFTVLYATSERNLEKTQEFQESVKKYLIKAGAFGGSGGQVQQGEKNNEVIESPLPTYKSSRPEDLAVTESTEKEVEQSISKEDRSNYLMDLYSDDLGVRLVVRGAQIFASGQAGFKKEALPFLSRLGKVIKKIDRRLLIEGHVDSEFESEKLGDLSLSQDRSLQFARYLAQVHKYPSNKLITAGFGSHRPLSGKQVNLNDRLEIIILFEDSPL